MLRSIARRAGRARPGAVIALFAAVLPAALAAQTPITAVGLGYSVAPLDARSVALGGIGLGLLDGTFSVVSPADLTTHVSPGFGLAFAGESVDVRGGAAPRNTGRERFTAIRAIAPFSDWAIGIAFGGAFDQDWTARFQDTLLLADGRVPFEEAREQDGGISTIDVSLARRLGRISVGVSAQRLNGSVRQTFFRNFELPLDGAPSLASTGGSQLLSYRGWRFGGGINVMLGDRFMLGGAGSIASSLTAEADDSLSTSSEIDLPARFDVGASARVNDRVLLTVNGGWSGWSTAGTVAGAVAHDIVWAGAGVEYSGLRLLGGEVPLRLGVRRSELPFSFGSDPIDESALTGGFGWSFRRGLAVVNLGFELGTRGDLDVDGLEESFQRLTVSFELRQP